MQAANISMAKTTTRFTARPASSRIRAIGAATLAILGMFGCSGVQEDGAPAGSVDASRIPDAVPRQEPKSRYGNPSTYKVNGKRYYTLKSSSGYRERGIASWYGRKFHGRLTSSREPYDMYAMTAAHRTLPLPTYVRVKNLRNGRSIVVRVNDRGPFIPNRVIDLSYVAATKLGIVRDGTGLVEVTAIDPTRTKTYTSAGSRLKGSVHADSPPRLFLQIGAFGNRYNAERLQARIEPALAATVRIQTLTGDSPPLYRVQVGPLASVQRVDDLSSRLQQDWGLNDMHVVVD